MTSGVSRRPPARTRMAGHDPRELEAMERIEVVSDEMRALDAAARALPITWCRSAAGGVNSFASHVPSNCTIRIQRSGS